MILPISHERMSARRWPIVTTLLFLACFFMQIVLSVRDRSGETADAHAQAVEYFAQHPYLTVKQDALPEFDRETLAAARAASSAVEAPDESTRADEQKKLDDRIAAAARAQGADSLNRRFGYVPESRSIRSLFTYPFLHEGWLQLVGNMWFFVFCGMNLEDRWGRVVFPLFYVACGVVAALVYGLFAPHETTPLIGASGAIAGCMGAFAFTFARTRVRFALLITLRPRTFTAPAYAVLPFWALFEALLGWITPGGHNAQMAHVGGFVFGVAAAAGLHFTGMDRRLDESIEKATVLGDDPRMDEARLLVERGDPQLAVAMLEGLAIEKPESIHVQDAIAEAARAAGDDAREQKARARAERLRSMR